MEGTLAIVLMQPPRRLLEACGKAEHGGRARAAEAIQGHRGTQAEVIYQLLRRYFDILIF